MNVQSLIRRERDLEKFSKPEGMEVDGFGVEQLRLYRNNLKEMPLRQFPLCSEEAVAMRNLFAFPGFVAPAPGSGITLGPRGGVTTVTSRSRWNCWFFRSMVH